MIGPVKWHKAELSSISLDAPVTILQARAVISALVAQRNDELLPAPVLVQSAASP